MSITIRPMRVEDLGRVSELSRQLGYPVMVNALATRFARIHDAKDQGLFVAESERHARGLVGWIHVHPQWLLETQPFAEIGGLVVDQEARRLGAGRALVNEALRWAKEQGFTRVCVRSNVDRSEAHDFYPALGFKRFKTQHNYELELPL